MQRTKTILFLFVSLCGLTTWAFQEFKIPFEADLYLCKQGFSLGYSYKYKQAMWVAYTLTAKNLQSKQVRRRDRFKSDPEVKIHPVRPKDYAKSGYDKGHLASAADMTYSLASMRNSFLMTNISPQIPGCNRGIWKRLETQVRHLAIREEKIYVITGPIFAGRPLKMGKAKISVPVAFYKVILDLTPPLKAIAFIVPNQTTKRRIASFAVSVDEVERITGYDFFSELDDKLEEYLESSNNYNSFFL